MNSREFLLLLGVTAASAVGQLLLRHGAKSWITREGLLRFSLSFIKGSAPLALLMVLGAPFLYWKALETVPLTRKERLSRRVVAGALLCCAGIAVWGL